MSIKSLSFLLLICGTLPSIYPFTFNQQSVQSHIFEPLRPKQPPKRITAECGSVVTEAYGLLEKTYKRGEVKDGSNCTWLLRAPTNHVVNVISVGFDLLDETSQERDFNDYSGSVISLYDRAAGPYGSLSQFTATEHQHVSGVFVSSKSNKEQLAVEIIYHDNKIYSTQKIFIKYEFLNVDEMYRLLRESNKNAQ